MDTVMPFVLLAMGVGIVLFYVAIAAAVAYAVGWLGWHMVHDHWSAGQTFRIGRDRLLGRAR